MQPIRILNLFNVMDRGGAETVVMDVYRNIDRSKIQFDFLVHGEKIGDYEKEIEELGGKIYRMPSFSVQNYFLYKKEIEQFFSKHTEYKIIHSHMAETGCIAFKCAKEHNVPIRICHSHSIPRKTSLKYPIRCVFNKLMRKYLTDRMACSEKVAIWQYGKGQDYLLIKNAIETEKFRFSLDIREKMRNELCLDDQFTVGHVGSFKYAKNHKFLIKVFSQIKKEAPKSKLVLVGDGELRDNIEEEIKNFNLENDVILLGVREDVPDILQAVDAFVFPSRLEGFGVSELEALASGLPCFVSKAVPKKTDMTDLEIQLSLDETPEFWAKEIIKKSIAYQRRDRVDGIIKSGYDISLLTQTLQDFYENKYAEICK